MKRIPLSQFGKNKGRYFAIVDDEDFERVSSLSWYVLCKKDGTNYAATRMRINRKAIYMHRFILDAPHSIQVDHRDRNGLNNTRANLRFATQSQNMANQAKQRNSGNPYKGTCRFEGKWVAQLCGRYLGRFDTPEAAALAYDCAALERFGEFARLNFPNGDGHEHNSG